MENLTHKREGQPPKKRGRLGSRHTYKYYIFRQITITPKAELRAFWREFPYTKAPCKG